MSRKYKFHNPQGLYFVSFATVYWIDLFVREIYFEIMTGSLKYCIDNKGLLLYSWCIMPSHVHLIFSSLDNKPGSILGHCKTFTSKALQKEISEHYGESRKEWLLWMFKRAGLRNSNVNNMQLWQQDNHPIELWSPVVIDQKMEYIHMNPVVAGFVAEPHYWKYSSAIDYNGGKGLLKLSDV